LPVIIIIVKSFTLLELFVYPLGQQETSRHKFVLKQLYLELNFQT